MSAVARIVESLLGHPDLEVDVVCGMVTVEPRTDDGFPVCLIEGDEWIVGFGGWHEHLTNEDEALNRFAFGLSDQCRLRVWYLGEYPYRWTVEERTEGAWRELGTSGSMFYPFWRRPRVELRQNAVFKAAAPGTPPDPAT